MKKNFGVFVGRFSPTHLAHEIVIRKMIEKCGVENCIIVLGSSNASMSLRHLFSYEDRRGFLKKLFPDIQIVGIPDYPSDGEWLLALDDILSLKGIDPKQSIFFGGCEEDINFFLEAGRKYQIYNRFDGVTPKISATEVRDALIQGRSLNNLLNPLLLNDIKDCFTIRWEKFRKI